MALITYLTRIEFEDGAVTRLPALLDDLRVSPGRASSTA